MSTLARIKDSRSKLPQDIVDVPEWDAKILVRGLTGGGREPFVDQVSKAQREDRDVPIFDFQLRLIFATARDPETEELLFSDEDIEWVRDLAPGPFDRLFAKAAELSGLAPKAVDEAGKDSSSSPIDGSSSVSLMTSGAPSTS